MIQRKLPADALPEAGLAVQDGIRRSPVEPPVPSRVSWGEGRAGLRDAVPAPAAIGIRIAPAVAERIIRLRDLSAVLIARDFKLRYKGSLLGIAWSLLTPLSFLLVLNFVFTVILPLGIPDYASFLFVGILVWSWFSDSLMQATGAIVDNRELVHQPGLPAAILPVVTVAVNMIHFFLALPVLAAFLWLNGIRPAPSLLVLPVLIGVQFLFTLSITYFMATLHVTFRDTKHLLGIALMLGFYVTPVFYSIEQTPARLRAFSNLNPMACLMGSYRDVLLHGSLPNPVPLAAVTIVSLILLALGYRFFMRASHRFVDGL